MLSDAQIRDAKPKDRSYKLFDAHQLFLLLTTGGSKLWRLNYKYDGKQKSLALGRYSSLGLAEARRLRDEALAKLREGHDPGVAKKLKLKATIEASRNTFEKVAREWHEVYAPQWAKVMPPTFSARSNAMSSLPSAACRSPRSRRPSCWRFTRLALRLIALTAVRPGELRGAEWAEFENLDGHAPLWRIPDVRMKGNLKRKDDVGGDHLVPLAPARVESYRRSLL
ncbi:integrase [Novosphingobium chloroacetimidivorans]|uniref:Integrase n=1 Tax=Novosphingobium chloroacetimidivorans TaxID=1428314 RepID=A0A7W7NWH0_9SPHN|nr:integrase arm-type DNA-binding domain-containing protein [Novosphingobium chloroacetimidivorans]MBB4858155.1 integrase [Novosphingobium chloroacetimidivorans]